MHPLLPSLTLALCLSAVGCGPPQGPATPRPVETPAATGVVQTRLPGRLTVAVEPRSGRETAALQLWIPAGAGDAKNAESASASSWVAAALCDAPGGLADQIAALGGSAQAWVSADATVFEIQIGADQLGAAIERLGKTVQRAPGESALGHVEAAVQRRAALAEQSAERRRLKRVLAEVPTAGPSGLDTLANSPAAVSPQAAIEFYRSTYRPEGARLVVVGQVDPVMAQAAALAAFDGWEAHEPAAAAAPQTPSKGATVRFDRRAGSHAWVDLGFTVPAASPDDAAALDVLGLLLSRGGGARLEAAGQRAGVSHWSDRVSVIASRRRGALVSRITVPAGQLEASYRAALAATASLALTGPSEAEVQSARQVLLRKARLTGQRDAGRARQIGYLGLRWPDSPGRDAYEQGLSRCTAASVKALAARTFVAKRLTAVLSGPLQDDVDAGLYAEQLAEIAKTVGAPEQVRGDARRFVIAPNVELVVAPRPNADAVAVGVLVEGGWLSDPGHRPGLSQVVGAHLGLPLGNGLAIDARVDGDHLAVFATAATGELDQAFASLTARLFAPRYRSTDTEQARLVATTTHRRASPKTRLLALLDQVLTKQTERPLFGALDVLESATPLELKRWHESTLGAGRLLFVVTGAVDPMRAERLAQVMLAGRVAGPKVGSTSRYTPADRPPEKARKVRRRHYRRSLDTPDGWIAVGFPLTIDSVQDLAAAQLLAELAGGRSSATYRQLTKRARGPFELQSAVNLHTQPALVIWAHVARSSVREPLTIIDGQLDRLRTQTLDDATIKIAKRALLARMAPTDQDMTELARRVGIATWRNVALGGVNGVRGWRAAVKRLTADDLMRFGARQLDPQQRAVAELSAKGHKRRAPVSLNTGRQ